MKVSVAWLRELSGIDLPVDELSRVLTMGGLEVEETAPVAADFEGVVVAHVREVAPHPDADKLRVAQVDAGTGSALQIVCGAPNVAAGQKVPCALVGAKLPGLAIKAAKLRGVESHGMLCSARELGLSDDHAGLLVLPPDAPVGRDIREYLELGDTVLTLKLTPNRGDCLSMAGVIREIAALTGRPAGLAEPKPVAATIPDAREVRITERKACGYYAGRVIRGLDPAARTPDWMARRLERAGLRPRSPLVDITNFVMLERGQPMHAFDDAKLKGAIDVRMAKPGEELKLLTEAWAEYIPNLLLITDESGPVALGGVMGGFDTMVTAATTDVFFEAAWFHPEAIQGRARALALASDAAYRFERGVDFAATRAALERATALTLEICGGRAGPVSEASGELPPREPTRVRPARVRALLGYDIADDFMGEAFGRLRCAVSREAAGFVVTPPSWRFDLAIEEDFVEEVARVHGFEHVPARVPRSSLPMVPSPEGRRSRHGLKLAAAALGYQEVVNYSFVSSQWEQDFAGNASAVRLANPIASNMDVMRSTLLGGLVAAVKSNLNRGEERVRLFEIGRCFLGEGPEDREQPERLAAIAYGSRLPEQWGEKSPAADFFDAKADLEAIAGASLELAFVPFRHPACHPGRCARVRAGDRDVGIVGELHPALQLKYELDLAPVLFELDCDALLEGRAPRFAGVSRMPAVRRDLAVVVDEKLPAGALLEAIRASVPACVRQVEVFDLYRGKGVENGQKSLAFRIVMQDTARTLTDAQVEEIVASVRLLLSQKFNALPRT